MPQKKQCKTTEEINIALLAAVEKLGTMSEDIVVLSEATVTRLLATQTLFSNTVMERATAQNNYSNSSALLESLREEARLFCSHFIQSFNLAVARGFFPESARAFYNLDIHSAAVPDLKADDKIILWINHIQTGEAARVAGGGVAMAMPTLIQFNVPCNAFKTAHTTQITNKEANDTIVKTLADLRDDAIDLINRVWGEVETYYIDLAPAARRAKCREWGVMYVSSPTDNSLMGRVVDTNNNPVNGAVLTIDQLLISSNSNSNGDYSFPLIAPGTYTLRVTKAGFQEKTIPNIVIETGNTTDLVVQLISTTGGLRGYITNNGQPLAGATISIDALGLSVITGVDGIGQLVAVAPGTYVVTVSKPNYNSQNLPGILINTGTITDFSADLVTNTGTLIANVYSLGIPLAGATVRIDSLSVQVITAGDGIGRLENLPPNTYNVTASAPGKVQVVNTIVINANQTASLTFDLPNIS